jgi:ligand-binding sensor domain-containing protein
MVIHRIRLSLVAFALLNQLLNAQQRSIQKGLFHLNENQGLSSNRVQALAQDERGFLWIGTNEGLNRFDGSDFVHYFHDPTNRAHSLSGNAVRGITVVENQLLICTNHGISLFNIANQRFENELLSDSRFNFTSNELINFIVRASDRWYIGGENILLELSSDFTVLNDLALQINRSQSSPARDFIKPTVDANNNIYFPSCGSLYHYNPSKQQFISVKNSTGEQSLKTQSGCFTVPIFLFNQDERILAEWSMNPRVESLNGATISNNIILKKQQPAYNGTTLDILQLNSNTLWFGGEYGLAEWNTETKQLQYQYLDADTARSAICRVMLRDKQNSIWIGTESGLFRYSQSANHFECIGINKSSELTNSVYAQQFLEHDGEIYFIQSEGIEKNLFKLENKEVITLPTYCSAEGARSMAVINNKELIIGGWSSLNKYTPSTRECSSFNWLPDSLKKNAIIAILVDKHQHIWLSFGVGKGIYRYHMPSGKAVHYVQEPQTGQSAIPIANAFDMTEDANGNVWFVRSKLDGKLIKWNCITDLFEEIHPKNPSASDMHFNSESYCVEAQGNIIWFGVMREGLFRFDSEKNDLQQFTRLDGLPSNDIMSITFDAEERIWVGTSHGICVFDYEKSRFTTFGVMQGLPNNDFNSASLFDPKSKRMYLSCEGNIIYFQPKDLFQTKNSPRVYLTSLNVEGKETSLNQNNFQPGENHFDFTFTAVDLMYADDFEYRYMLVGLDQDWIISGKTKTAGYANIPPGQYAFQVSVKTGGEWREAHTIYSFELPPAFYMTWWFVLLVILFITTILYIFFQMRSKRLREMENVRSRISRDLHDDIGSALSGIRIMSGQRSMKEEVKTEVLSRIHLSSQKMLDDMDDIIWTINPNNDKGEHLFSRMREFTGEILESAGIEYTLNFQENIEKTQFNLNQKRNVYLIYKESLNNLVKHSRAKSVTVHFVLNERLKMLELTVQDDGDGIETTRLNKNGNGLVNMKKRAEEINGKLILTSSNELGTNIFLQFPIT